MTTDTGPPASRGPRRTNRPTPPWDVSPPQRRGREGDPVPVPGHRAPEPLVHGRPRDVAEVLGGPQGVADGPGARRLAAPHGEVHDGDPGIGEAEDALGHLVDGEGTSLAAS